jgi:hypothetical protein
MSITRRKQVSELMSLKDVMNHFVEDSFYLPRELLDTWTGDGSLPVGSSKGVIRWVWPPNTVAR